MQSNLRFSEKLPNIQSLTLFINSLGKSIIMQVKGRNATRKQVTKTFVTVSRSKIQWRVARYVELSKKYFTCLRV